MKSANDNEVNDDVGARELYDETDIRFPNLFFSPQWTSVINTNLGSLFNMSRQVIEGMRERKFGRIINISSINGQKGPVRPDQLFGREAGEIGFTKALAQEGARLGVTVNAIAPGYINTEVCRRCRKRCWKTSCRQSRSAGAASRRRSDAAWYFLPPMMPGLSPAPRSPPMAVSTLLRCRHEKQR
jgi:NAD(P)-dependent dehydrogenase (short-subunit alcohol dehydrogenase family)